MNSHLVLSHITDVEFTLQSSMLGKRAEGREDMDTHTDMGSTVVTGAGEFGGCTLHGSEDMELLREWRAAIRLGEFTSRYFLKDKR